jgi:hypothetical protein
VTAPPDVRQEAERHLRRLLPDDPLHTIVSALLAQLAAQEHENARLKKAISANHATDPAWTIDDFANLAEANRADSESVDEHGTPNGYDMTYDYEAVHRARNERIAAAESARDAALAQVAQLREALQAIINDALGHEHDPLWIVRRDVIQSAAALAGPPEGQP